MQTATKFIWTVALATSVLLVGGLAVFGSAAAKNINLPAVGNVTDDDDEKDEPDVKARVGRISFIHGTAKVRHAGDTDWTVVTLNLPIVEGDELATDEDSRIEVQFDKWQHMRLEENSYLKVTTLRDEGIAVSISIGTMNVRITSFDKARQFFEIDAPKSTVAVERSGSYRIDAGREGSTEVRASVKSGGEARIYSDTAGFTLKNDRSARIYIDGPNAGEWDTADAGKLADDFDAWTLDRDDVIAKRLRSASYGTYYDDDIYGADDLTDYGAWVYTRDYGWIWRPFPQTTASYVDWSPYRYGHWSWIPPFGWTWVNDEPWGWATYHHGRWIYVNGGWSWTPYGYYRPARSWWFPALVAINIVVNDICWYPLGYHHRYQHYNNSHWRDRDTRGPTRHDNIPPNSVVAMDKKKFGGPKGPRKLGEGDVKKILDGNGGPTPILPSYSDIKKNLGEELVARQPKLIDKALVRQVGVGDRKGGAPVDDDLRRTRILGGREPIRVGGGGLGTGIGGATGTGIGGANGTGIGGGNGTGIGGPTRQTGAIRRDPIKMPAPGPTPRNGDGRLPDPILPPNPGNGEETVRRTREPIKVPAPDPTRRGNNGRIPDPLPPNPGNGDDNRRTREPIKIAPPDPKGTREPIRIEQPPRETRRSDPPPKVDRPPDKPKDTPPPKQQEPPKKEAPAPSKIEHKGKPDGI